MRHRSLTEYCFICTHRCMEWCRDGTGIVSAAGYSHHHPAAYYVAFICPDFFPLRNIPATASRNNALSMILSAGSCSLFWPQFCLAAGYWINGNAVGAVRLRELWKPVTAAGLMENTTSSQRSRARWIQTARRRLLWSADSTRRGRDNGKCPLAEEQRGIKVKWRCSEREGQDYWLIGLGVFYPSLVC